MIQSTVTLLNKVGLHARPAAKFVQTAKKFKAKIFVEKDGREANAKSILEVLSLGAEYLSVITIKADGEDECEAVKALVDLVSSKFGEE
jgi:phosphocarrier protein